MLKKYDYKFGDCFEKKIEIVEVEEMEINYNKKDLLWFVFWILKGKLKFKMFLIVS